MWADPYCHQNFLSSCTFATQKTLPQAENETTLTWNTHSTYILQGIFKLFEAWLKAMGPFWGNRVNDKSQAAFLPLESWSCKLLVILNKPLGTYFSCSQIPMTNANVFLLFFFSRADRANRCQFIWITPTVANCLSIPYQMQQNW